MSMLLKSSFIYFIKEYNTWFIAIAIITMSGYENTCENERFDYYKNILQVTHSKYVVAIFKEMHKKIKEERDTLNKEGRLLRFMPKKFIKLPRILVDQIFENWPVPLLEPSYARPIFFELNSGYLNKAQVACKIFVKSYKDEVVSVTSGMWWTNNKKVLRFVRENKTTHGGYEFEKNRHSFVKLSDGIAENWPVAFSINEKNNYDGWTVIIDLLRDSSITINKNNGSVASKLIHISSEQGDLVNLSLFTKYNGCCIENLSLIVATHYSGINYSEDQPKIEVFDLTHYGKMLQQGQKFIPSIKANSVNHKIIDVPKYLLRKNFVVWDYFDALFAVTQRTFIALTAYRVYVVALDIKGNKEIKDIFYEQKFDKFQSVKYITKDPDDPTRLLVLSKNGYIFFMSLHDRSLVFLHSDPLAHRVWLNGRWIMIEQEKMISQAREPIRGIVYFDGNDLINKQYSVPIKQTAWRSVTIDKKNVRENTQEERKTKFLEKYCRKFKKHYEGQEKEDIVFECKNMMKEIREPAWRHIYDALPNNSICFKVNNIPYSFSLHKQYIMLQKPSARMKLREKRLQKIGAS